jgi:hypothetical protein
MMTLDRGSFSSLRDVRHAVCDVSGFNVTCSQVDTHLRHCFYSSNKETLYHSGLFCACRHRTVVSLFSKMSSLGGTRSRTGMVTYCARNRGTRIWLRHYNDATGGGSVRDKTLHKYIE